MGTAHLKGLATKGTDLNRSISKQSSSSHWPEAAFPPSLEDGIELKNRKRLKEIVLGVSVGPARPNAGQ